MFTIEILWMRAWSISDARGEVGWTAYCRLVVITKQAYTELLSSSRLYDLERRLFLVNIRRTRTGASIRFVIAIFRTYCVVVVDLGKVGHACLALATDGSISGLCFILWIFKGAKLVRIWPDWIVAM